jgi:hypothetical protein
MSTQFRPLEIPPGVVATPTKKMRSSNWAEVNLMRWVETQMAPIGGQSKFNYTFASRCKAIHGWYDLQGTYYKAFLCEQHLYVEIGGVLTNITPTGGITAPISPTIGGYGDGLYSASTYGTARSSPSIIPIDQLPGCYSLDNFGAILLAMASPDGRLLKWDPHGGTGGVADALATQVTSTDTGTGFAPSGRCFVVTPERFVLIFGMINDGTTDGGSPRRFGWCDQENFHAWDFSDVTSQAGFLDIEPASPIVAALSTRNGVLFWTGKKAYISKFIGIPYVYNYTEIADNCTPWSPESMVTTSSQALWMSKQGLFAYDGTSISPIACLVRPWIDDDIDPLNVREQACAVHVADFNEFWWFFPQLGQPYNTRAFIFNYKEGWFSQARMSRSAGVTAAYNVQTIMADGMVAFQHELGAAYNNAALPFAETFDLNLTSGARMITIKQMLPDIEGDITNVQYVLFYRNSRSLGASELATPPKTVRSDGYVDFRTTGRDVRMRLQLVGPAVNPVTVGQHLVDGVARGDR